MKFMIRGMFWPVTDVNAHKAYAQAYFRMSFLGVKNLNNLTEISKVVPSRR